MMKTGVILAFDVLPLIYLHYLVAAYSSSVFSLDLKDNRDHCGSHTWYYRIKLVTVVALFSLKLIDFYHYANVIPINIHSYKLHEFKSNIFFIVEYFFFDTIFKMILHKTLHFIS